MSVGLFTYIYFSNFKLEFQVWSQIFSKIFIFAESCAEQNPTERFGCADIGQPGLSPPLRFAAFGDYGSNSDGEWAVANLVKSFDPDLIITTGDNSYTSGVRPGPIDDNVGQYFSDYIGDYTGKYGPGSSVNRFFPSIGNHDDDNGDISVYLDYFTLPGIGTNKSGNERYYDFVKGPVHFFAVNSTKETEPDGISNRSKQAQWIRNRLAKSVSPWKIVYFHHSPYSSAKHGSNPTMQWNFEDWDVTAVLSGHDHVYERILRDDNGDGIDLPYFVIGLGGHQSIYKFSDKPVKGSTMQYNAAHGALIVDATENKIIFSFYSIENKRRLADRFSINKVAGIKRADSHP